MTIYRCSECAQDIETETLFGIEAIQVTPCKTCLKEAKQEGREEGEGLGFEKGYDTALQIEKERERGLE